MSSRFWSPRCSQRCEAALGVVLLLAPLSGHSQAPASLTIEKQGSFFVGGEKKSVRQPATASLPAQSGDITVNQMYVQYQIPLDGNRHVPIVMVHGCCLSSKSWETTPDGRAGWNAYFLRQGRAVYLADQVSRGRSGFDPTPFNDVRTGKIPASALPIISSPTHQLVWKMFRFGPEFGRTFPDQQFPMEAVEELYKEMIPDLNQMLPQDHNPTWTQMAALAAKLNGAILMAHSESGFFPQHAALIKPAAVKGIVSLETDCEKDLTAAQIDTLAAIPTLFVFGDHLADVVVPTVTGKFTWAEAYASCNTLIGHLRGAGGDAEMLHLPAVGIKGNSHMIMQDRNSDQVAELILAWVEQHVERRRSGAPSDMKQSAQQQSRAGSAEPRMRNP